MAKNAEDRYQSALGLKYDLEKCQQQWQETGKIEPFELGERDICDRFTIPEKLYGRQAEVETLLAAFERVSQGSTEMMLVAGFSGIGKTAVVNEVHKPIVRQRGYFIKGKFDQFNRNIPFSVFVQAFRDLMGQLLSEADRQLLAWKSSILQALGDNARVLIEVIPELERIIGQQPPAPKLSGTAAQNRFHLLFQKFIQVFTAPEHPLVMFLDDLQWADSASLKLMQLLVDEAQMGYLLLIGAYRDNEVFPAHPLVLTLDEVGKTGATVKTIELKPLSQTSLNRLVAETLNCAETLAQPLTELVYQKTQGNPFFATQFLKALHQDGLISFDVRGGYWQCDITQVRTAALTDDVVEFMAQQLQKLPLKTQTVLKLAACIGNPFDLSTLAIVSERSESDAADALWQALQEGLAIPQNEVYKFYVGQNRENVHTGSAETVAYRFLHDRVQQAAYSLIPEDQKQVTHWKIGQLLGQGLSEPEQVEQIFDIVNQLNLGRGTISNPAQQKQLARLNLQAGQKAKLSVAHQAALDYCAIGIDLLPSEAWQTDYDLMYALHRDAAEAAYLCGNFDRAEALYAIALPRARTPLDKAVIYRVQMTQYQLQGRNGEAIAIQRQSLQLLGWTMPVEPERIQASLDEQIAVVNRFLERQTVESILELPHMTDEKVAEMLRILQILFYAAWLDGQPLLALLALAKMTTLSLQYGNSDMSPVGYVGYGFIAIPILKNAALGHQFGEMAVQLCEQFDNDDTRGMANFFFAADVHSWSRPLREADRYYDNAFKYGMDAGNWLTVGFTMMLSGSDRLTYGKNLHDLYAIAQTHADFLRRVKSLENLDALIVGVLQPIRHLLGLTATPFSFDDESFSESEYLQKYSNANYHLAWYYSVKIRHAYLFDRQAAYPDLIPKLSVIENTVATHAKVPSSVFYVALMHLALMETAGDESQRQSHWQATLPLEERLRRWEKDCPENIRHKCLLIQAEKARLQGQKAEAIDWYEQAATQAQSQGYGYEAALANELAAKFYLNWGKERLARDSLIEAYYGYARWGAKAKTDDLEQRYPHLLTPILARQQLGLGLRATLTSPTNSATMGLGELFDLDSLMKAARTLSQEIDLDRAIANLMQTVLENAGAETAALMLWHEQTLRLEAKMTQGTLEPIHPISVEESQDVPSTLINTVKRTRRSLVLNNASDNPAYAGDAYLQQAQPQSILCAPLIARGQLIGILYLENHQCTEAFRSDRVEILNLLCSQAAISLENARLYRQAQQALTDLQQAQLQLIQKEKMATLGNLVAGVAHEINNPVGFIGGNIVVAREHLQDLLAILALYQDHASLPDEIAEAIEDLDPEFIYEDFPKLIASMQSGCDRIAKISTSLRTFSRADTDAKTDFNLHEGIDSTLLILKYRLKANEQRPAVEIVKNYGDIPEIQCYPGQLNQVFMNLLANAIDALEESNEGQTFAEIETAPNCITIRTEFSQHRKSIIVGISDNGKGIEEDVKARLFEQGFTTKGVGKGTGLGMAIARQIIEEKHGGTIICESELGKGTEFIISLPLS
ncbi:MAG: AAA family ATPase [Spirulina sp.]